MPSLVKLGDSGKSPLIVETYKGKGVLRIALRDIINNLKESGGEVLCTSVSEIESLKNKTVCDQYARDMIRYRIREKVIIAEGSKGIFTDKTSRYRMIRKKYFNPNPVQIYGDCV